MRTLSAQTVGVSPETTGTKKGERVVSLTVRVALALPEELIVPTAVAVSTCATLTKEPTCALEELKARVRPAAVAVCAELSMSKENAASEVRDKQVFMIRRICRVGKGVKDLRRGIAARG